MAKTTIIVTLAIFAICHGSEIFEDALPNTDTCNKNCSEAYQPSGPVEECQRGCRFHVIEEFVSDVQNATMVKISCHGACVESYSENSVRTEACKNGCNIRQKVVVDGKKEEDEGPSIHLLSPVMQVRAVYSSFVGAVHVIRSSLITYFVSDDDSIVAVESEPEIVLGIDPEFAGQNPFLQSQQQQQQPRQLSTSDDSGEPSVVKCVGRRIGLLPPYILLASSVALVIFVMYVIIAFCSTTTPSKAKAYASEKTMSIDPMALPVKLVRPEDLTRLSLTEEDDLQAPALPTKVKLQDSLI